jgi:hypothetical protein
VSSIPLVRIDIVALETDLGFERSDDVVEITKADWTFGFGRAQFLEGDL